MDAGVDRRWTPGSNVYAVDMLVAWSHASRMSMIQIRNVPVSVHRRAKARAAMEGTTLSDLALRALVREIERPSVAEINARIRSLEAVEGGPSGAEIIRAERDAR